MGAWRVVGRGETGAAEGIDGVWPGDARGGVGEPVRTGIGVVIDEGQDFSLGGAGTEIPLLRGAHGAGGADAEPGAFGEIGDGRVRQENEVEAPVGLGVERVKEAPQDGAVARARDDEGEVRAVRWRGRQGCEAGVVMEEAGAIGDGQRVDQGPPDRGGGEAAPAMLEVEADRGVCVAEAAIVGDGEKLEVKGEAFDEEARGGVTEDLGADQLHAALGVGDGQAQERTD